MQGSESLGDCRPISTNFYYELIWPEPVLSISSSFFLQTLSSVCLNNLIESLYIKGFLLDLCPDQRGDGDHRLERQSAPDQRSFGYFPRLFKLAMPHLRLCPHNALLHGPSIPAEQKPCRKGPCLGLWH